MYNGDRTCVCLSAVWRVLVEWAGLGHHLGWCRAGVHSSSGVTAEEAAATNISSPGILCSPVHNDRLHCGWRFIWRQGATPRHTEYRRGHSSNTTDKQTHNISLQIFFKTSKYFFRPGSSLTWRPDDLAAQLGQAAGTGHGGNPGAGGHLNLNMTAS